MLPLLPTRAPDRSDERTQPDLVMQAQERLRNSPYAELRRVSCTLEAGVLKLHGAVPRYYLKQHAYRVVANLEGVRHVENDIIVGQCSEANREAAVGAA
jgi:osmotically-inducible protein OsmY